MMDFERELCGLAGDRVKKDEPLSRHTTFRIGGPADYFVTPESEDELAAVVALCRRFEIPFFLLGNGSDLLCADDGYRGVAVNTTACLNSVRTEGFHVFAGAGALLGSVAREALSAGLTGLEFAAGIPGSVGGAMVMNAGAYGGEMGQVVEWVRVLTPHGEVRTVPVGEMNFAYRHSAVHKNGWIVLAACFGLQPGEPEQIRGRMDELAAKRREKQPLEYPSAGSTFKRPEGYYAARLIEEAGLKGCSVGGACVSEKHAGFVINREEASAADVLELCRIIKERVKEYAGVELEMEVEIIGGCECHFPPM